mmetsp:Transcript_9766/g.20846  ORF Transcript_9766/g.20846 Transcript_9766/m.20846 type:complete len:372 (-) Transcript_9766:64-1179(-)
MRILSALCAALGFGATIADTEEVWQVDFLLVRHALSCANVIEKHGANFFAQKSHVLMRDPRLTNCGVAATERAAQPTKDNAGSPDVVVSSSLMRAIETALHQFPGSQVIPVPFLSEKSVGQDNTPKDVESQVQLLQYMELDHRVNETFMKMPEFENGRRNPSWKKFVAFAEDYVVPGLVEQLKAAGEKPGSRPLKVAVVTHSMFIRDLEPMKSVCKPLMEKLYKRKPSNNMVLSLSYSYYPSGAPDDHTEHEDEDEWEGAGPRKLHSNTECSLVHQPPTAPDQVCRRDVQSCDMEWVYGFEPTTVEDRWIAKHDEYFEALRARQAGEAGESAEAKEQLEHLRQELAQMSQFKCCTDAQPPDVPALPPVFQR